MKQNLDTKVKHISLLILKISFLTLTLTLRLPGHAVSDLFGLALEHVKSNDPFVLKAREAFLIKKFDSFKKGLNQEH